jgi:hypothetical protein
MMASFGVSVIRYLFFISNGVDSVSIGNDQQMHRNIVKMYEDI